MDLDVSLLIKKMFLPIFTAIKSLFFGLLSICMGLILLFFLFFFLRYRVNPFKLNADYLAGLKIKFKPYNLLRWFLWDFATREDRVGEFKPYGFSIFVGEQGAGKTISMVNYLNEKREEYPDCLIVTNFDYEYADCRMQDWRDLLEIRNGTKGVIFAIDEIHSEYSSSDWKDFPESILSEISQQRKQRIKIVSTAQVFARVVKPIREQTFSVIVCSTFFGRFTTNKEYKAAEYATADTPYQVKKKVKPIWKHAFVQSNNLRCCYDTYEKIERMKKLDFIPRNER